MTATSSGLPGRGDRNAAASSASNTLGRMWRQVRVDQELLNRVRRATFLMLARASLPTYAVFCLLTAVTAGLAATGGDWAVVIIGGVVLLTLPLVLWRSALRGVRAPLGTYLAYAVTPDGTFHYSAASGTTTVNPGFVARLSASPDCWFIVLATGLLIVAPREAIPDADAALLVRHLPKRPSFPAAVRPPL